LTSILLTNDDGVFAPGLAALRKALDPLGQVRVVTTDKNWSATGHTKTMHKPLRVRTGTLIDGSPAHVISGTPSDCVALALLGLWPERPDIVVSGINLGANLGQDMTYSATVSAAMEAAVFGVPGLAVSLDANDSESGQDKEPDYRFAAELTVRLIRLVLERGLPKMTFLNVNVPNLPADQIRGVLFTRLGRRIYRDELVIRKDPRGREYYWIGGEPPAGELDEGTDIWALAHGYASVTPLHLDMTDYDFIDTLRSWWSDL